jgi:metal-dependent amidase/aminoacylase/carboxypeptidase family protein
LIAKSAGATAEVTIVELYDVTVNDEALTEQFVPTLSRAAQGQLVKMDLMSGSEDFSFFGKEVPAFFFFLGITPKDRDPKTAPAAHSPSFFLDESALVTGVRAMAGVAVDFLEMNAR